MPFIQYFMYLSWSDPARSWFPAVADTNWEIMGAADFSGDGKTDIVWRNKATGDNLLWLMDGATYMGSAWLPGVADTNWEIVGP